MPRFAWIKKRTSLLPIESRREAVIITAANKTEAFRTAVWLSLPINSEGRRDREAIRRETLSVSALDTIDEILDETNESPPEDLKIPELLRRVMANEIKNSD